MELHADLFKGKGELSTKFVLRKIGAELIEFLFHVGKVEKKRKKKSPNCIDDLFFLPLAIFST